MIKSFDGYTMRGVAEGDNEAILEHIEKDIDLTVDECGRVWNSAGTWIADYIEAGDGEGILCE